MSYLVLARKSRPQTFEEVVGQKPVVKTLQNSLRRNRVAHAILFSGVRGVGKTTLARLMAKAINCENGPTPTPCNTCLSCTQITSGSSLDLHEIDGASNRGIQEVRDLKEKIKFMPTSSSHKIVIIDEVHMLTTEAFNALLKTLEEPPEHVFFMFATTELHKIPITILSRCQRYELRRVSSEELTTHFSNLAASENIEIEPGALSLIVREAEGSVRDGLSLLDQVFSFGESPISQDEVVEVLGLVSRDVLNNITRALLAGDRGQAIKNLDETFRFGMDVKRFMTDLLECFRMLLLVKLEGCEKLLDLSEDDLAWLKDTAQDFSTETIHQKLCLLMKAAEGLRHSLQPRLLLETTFLSIIETGNVTPLTSLLAELDTRLSSHDRKNTESPSPQISQPVQAKKKIAEPETPAPEIRQQSFPPPQDQDAPPVDDDEPPWEVDVNKFSITAGKEPEQKGKPQEPSTPPVSEPAAVKPEETPVMKRDIRKDWVDFIGYVKERKPWMAQNLQQASGRKEHGQELLLEYNDPAECILLRAIDNRKILTMYVLDFFQKEYDIHFITPDKSDDPDMKASEGPKKQRQKLASHPIVRMAEDVLGGQVGDIRIGPTAGN